MDIIYALVALCSSVAAILAWLAKLRWSREFAQAKEATIEAKNEQIEVLKNEIQNLREFTPMKLREYFLSVKEQLEEYNTTLNSQIEEANKEIMTKAAQIAELGKTGSTQSEQIARLEGEKEEITKKTDNLQKQLDELKKRRQTGNIPEHFIQMPDLKELHQLALSSQQLRDAMAHALEPMSINIQEAYKNLNYSLGSIFDTVSTLSDVSLYGPKKTVPRQEKGV